MFDYLPVLSLEDGGENVSPQTISRICGRDSDVARA